jgi:hypothetical protein
MGGMSGCSEGLLGKHFALYTETGWNTTRLAENEQKPAGAVLNRARR